MTHCCKIGFLYLRFCLSKIQSFPLPLDNVRLPWPSLHSLLYFSFLFFFHLFSSWLSISLSPSFPYVLSFLPSFFTVSFIPITVLVSYLINSSLFSPSLIYLSLNPFLCSFIYLFFPTSDFYVREWTSPAGCLYPEAPVATLRGVKVLTARNNTAIKEPRLNEGEASRWQREGTEGESISA